MTCYLGLRKWLTLIANTHIKSWACWLLFIILSLGWQKQMVPWATGWSAQNNWWAPGKQKICLTGSGQCFWRQPEIALYMHMWGHTGTYTLAPTYKHMYSRKSHGYKSMASFSFHHMQCDPCRELCRELCPQSTHYPAMRVGSWEVTDGQRKGAEKAPVLISAYILNTP